MSDSQGGKPRLVVATSNPHKLEEIRAIAGHMVEFVGLSAFGGIVMPEETGSTFVENARLKALAVAQQTGQPSLADDSGLCVDALGGAPGVQSNRFLGDDCTPEDRNSAILSLLGHTKDEERTARFVCSACIALPTGETIESIQTCEGLIATRESGAGGFGYDPIFFVPGLGCTLADVSARTKNSISHRGKAVGEVVRLFAAGSNP